MDKIMPEKLRNSNKKFQRSELSCYNSPIETFKSLDCNNYYNPDWISIHGRFMDIFMQNSGMPDDFATQQIVYAIFYVQKFVIDFKLNFYRKNQDLLNVNHTQKADKKKVLAFTLTQIQK